MSIIQCYAPTAVSNEDEIEKFYNELNKCMKEFKAELILVMGDFNAKIGLREPGEERILGSYGYGERNKRGERLIQWLWENDLLVGNTMFSKKEKNMWTWSSPDKKVKNQIDYIICNKRSILQDVNVVNNFTFDSDHRLLRAKIKINRFTRNIIKNKNKTHILKVYPEAITKTYVESIKKDFSNFMEDFSNDIQQQYNITEAILKSNSKKYLEININNKQEKLSQSTKIKIQRRNELVKKETLNAAENQELKRLRKEIKKESETDIKNYNAKRIKEIIEESGSTHKVREFLSDGKKWITELNNKRGKGCISREKILYSATEFYERLYKSQHNKQVENETITCEEIPMFLKSEVSNAIKELKNEKSYDANGIKAEMIKFCSDIMEVELQKLFNNILLTEIFPVQWTYAEILVVFKKGNKKDIENYRPISIILYYI